MVWKPDYVDLDALRDYVTRSGETVDDAFLTIAAGAASRAVDRHCGRQFGKSDTAQARRYSARWDRRRRRWIVDVDDLYSNVGLVVAVAAGPVTVEDLEPVNALANGKVYERLIISPDSANQPTGRLENEITLTSDKWGWPAFPVPVVQATLIHGSRLSFRRDESSSPPDDEVDLDVQAILGDYVRWWAAG